ncbi:antibiotic biosynthesis monooxygenase [Pseudomonas syringae pv. actinidiae ICMP 19096]|uniref:Antibiotic biosynthesis monooxygenase n=1 Tax=Pseudomonas syringae pv. actinidiae ICMP 19096 TaxID=1194405 RepID=A0A656JZD5_PSESF|nr:antibiotic biosynthesis monooxygenase [Pseudomonas syringae pv. actinidiae ICMP 19096]
MLIRNSQFTQLVEFIVAAAHAADLAAALIARVEQITCFYPGFISGRVHLNREGDRVLMQLLWSSKEHGEHALEQAGSVEPDLLGLACKYYAAALLCSTYDEVIVLSV